jgi:hypothetical protein
MLYKKKQHSYITSRSKHHHTNKPQNRNKLIRHNTPPSQPLGREDRNKPSMSVSSSPTLCHSETATRCRPEWPLSSSIIGPSPSKIFSTCYFQVGNCFIYLFYHDFAKIYGPPQILQKYTPAVVAHSVRDITSWPTVVGATRSGPLVWPRRGAVRHGVKSLASQAMASGPSAVGRGGSRPASAVGHGARVQLPITPKFSWKCHNSSKKERGRGEGSEEEEVKVRSSAGFSSRQR